MKILIAYLRKTLVLLSFLFARGLRLVRREWLIPQNYKFPALLVHTHDPWTIKNWKHLSRGYDEEERIKICIERIRGHTMVTHDGLLHSYRIARYIVRRLVPGAFVETGCCQGGAAAMLAYAALHEGEERSLHLFDSFKGLPKPHRFEWQEWMERDWKISKQDATGEITASGALVADKSDAERVLFEIVCYSKASVFFHVGWFQDTIPRACNFIGEISLLRLDGDLFDSTLVALRHLYPLVVKGGFVIIDDYALIGCRSACETYFKEEGIDPYLHYIDGVARYFVKN